MVCPPLNACMSLPLSLIFCISAPLLLLPDQLLEQLLRLHKPRPRLVQLGPVCLGLHPPLNLGLTDVSRCLYFPW
jgi:hypothetical protein